MNFVSETTTANYEKKLMFHHTNVESDAGELILPKALPKQELT